MFKPKEWTSRVNLNVNYGPWVIMMYQHRSINYNKCSLVEDVDDGGGYVHVRAASIWESLYLLLSFATNLKLL